MFHVALFGAGRMGQIHLANLLALPHVMLKYIYDPFVHDEKLILNSSARVVNDVATVLADKDIDACIIAAPSTQHIELITACAQASKHVFCEKPISVKVNELRALKDIVDKACINLQIGFNRRFDPSFQEIQRQVRNNAIGAIHIVKIVNRDPTRPRLEFVKDSGGLFFDFNVHDFDMLRFITDDDITEVYAVGDALVEPALKVYQDIDTAIITAKTANGRLCVIDASRETGYGYDQQLEVLGERGMLHVKNQSPTEVSLRTHRGCLHDVIHHSFVERYRDSYRLELLHFFESIGTRTPCPNIDDAIAAIKIARAAVTSLKENRPVLCAE